MPTCRHATSALVGCLLLLTSPTLATGGSGEFRQTRFSLGRQYGLHDGWGSFGRLELGVMVDDRSGRYVGLTLGAEMWGRSLYGEAEPEAASYGYGLPLTLYLGSDVGPIAITGNVGFHLIILDVVEPEHDTGIGFLAPLAGVAAGLQRGPWALFSEVRVQYRWQFGARDQLQTQLSVGVAFGYEK